MSAAGVLGLDVGNTCCTMAVMRHGTVQLIANEQGSRSTPTTVAFADGETLLGEAAAAQAARNPKLTMSDLLLMLGRDFDDPVVQAARSRWGFLTSAAEKDGAVSVAVPGGKTHTAVRLLSLVVGGLRGAADSFCGAPVREVVLATPAHLAPSRADALLEAARGGGMRVKLALPSPLAVALLRVAEIEAAAAGGDGAGTDAAGGGGAAPRRLLVGEGGGGCWSASVVDLGEGPEGQAEGEAEGEGGGEGGADCGGEAAAGPRSTRLRRAVARLSIASTASDETRGAAQVDAALVALALKDIRRRSRVDLSGNARAKARLGAAAEACKRSLSGGTQAQTCRRRRGRPRARP